VWIDPRTPGTYVGQCAEYCGLQHALMRLVVIVHPPDEFRAWVASQQTAAAEQDATRPGRELFSSLACINCHSVRGTSGNGVFGPDLTHLMSRATLGHTGQKLTASASTQAIYAAAIIAVVARICAVIEPLHSVPLLHLAAFAWAAAFIGFAISFGPVLIRYDKRRQTKQESIANNS
jgi:cytochrome c553